MSYQVIARKWRPQTFEGVVGQNHITQTLTNALKNGRIPHAILLTGPRGTGKTTSARILAKALRCPNAVEFVPCNQCDQCAEISQGTNVDVLEIDGASNNGVDSIRELRDTVSYQPSSGTYKVYIIDEVHMLSTSAFNALLKTLEEPPAHVVFIMATTDVHKIPATILSRCQRFDFRRITTRQIADHLLKICKAENINCDPEALWLIARHGDGSMRDSLSLLDQIISYSQGELSKKNVAETLGLSDRELILELVETLIHRDRSRMVGLLERFYYGGFEPRIIAQELLEMIRHLLMSKIAVSRAAELIDLPETELQTLARWSGQISEEDLHVLFDMGLKGLQDIQRGTDPQMIFEVILLRMVSAPSLGDIKQMLAGGNYTAPQPVASNNANASIATNATASLNSMPRPASTGNPINSRGPTGTAPARAAGSTAAARTPTSAPKAPTEPEKKKSLPPREVMPTLEGWAEFVNSIKDENPKLAASLEPLVFEKMEGKVFHLAIPPHLSFLKSQLDDSTFMSETQKIIDTLWGQGYALKIRSLKVAEAGESALSFQAKKRELDEADLKSKLKQRPDIKKAMDVFGLEIKNIRDSKGQ
ncbi:MAG: DNA polymerase III subunit gamma/tau [Bdellovibrionota bacterium]